MKNIAKSDYLPDLREIEELFDSHKHEYSEEVLRGKAKEDAAANIPRPDSDQPSPFEDELTHACSTLASKVASRFRSALEIIDAKIKAEEEKIRVEHKNELENVNAMYDIDADASENAFGLTDAHKQLEIADERFDMLYSKHGRGPVHYVPHWLYLIFAFLIFVGEIPLNALVFQIFGENQVMTWVMAFIIGLAVPLVAHFIGIKMREHGEGFSYANAAKATAAFAIITIALYGLSVMRQTYLGEFKSELGLTDTLVESSFMFFWLNMAVFLAAIIVAYLAHDAVPGFQEAKDRKKGFRKAVEKREKKRVAELVKIGKQKAFALNNANARYREKKIETVMLKGIYDQVLHEGRECENRCLQLLWKNISIYRHENLKNRENSDESPKSFAQKLEFPLQLEGLSEKLDNDNSEEKQLDA